MMMDLRFELAVKFLGADHVEWLMSQPIQVVENRINGGWAANDLESADHLCVIRDAMKGE